MDRSGMKTRLAETAAMFVQREASEFRPAWLAADPGLERRRALAGLISFDRAGWAWAFAELGQGGVLNVVRQVLEQG